MSLMSTNGKWSCEGPTLLELWSWKGATHDEWSCKGAILVAEWWSCKQWSFNELFFVTDCGVVLLGLCGGTLCVVACKRVTFFVVHMAPKAEDIEASLGTLNSIIL